MKHANEDLWDTNSYEDERDPLEETDFIEGGLSEEQENNEEIKNDN